MIGFSFGADIIPSVYNRLRQSLKDRVPMITLLSPEPAADWEIRVAGWLGAAPSAEATPLGPPMETIPGKMIQCFYGEPRTPCPTAPNWLVTGAEVIEKEGIHHFDGNYALIAHQILVGLERRLANGT